MRWKVYDPHGELVASCRYVADAAAFWAALTILFATAATYTIATLLGEPDMERFQMGNRVLVVVAVLGPLAAMGYVFSRSLKYK
jgi:hypothetical protein